MVFEGFSGLPSGTGRGASLEVVREDMAAKRVVNKMRPSVRYNECVERANANAMQEAASEVAHAV